MEFEVVIGLETHVQLSTKTKIFCGSSAEFGAEPNENIDPLTLGLPGALPVVNKRVIEFAVMMGLATGCQIRKLNRFARKHYFYPDLPKGYQTSQFDEPICEMGSLTLRHEGITRTIGIKRIHMEEDAGKNIHDSRTHASLVDLNRAGVPLLEIVTQPDLRSPAEAAAFLKTMRQLVRFMGVSDGNMEEGSLRCDANISIRPRGESKLGTRTEIKNMNSFKFVERALEYEVARQIALVKSGGTVTQETLLFDSATSTTRPMRSKEESADYRYFPCPDLPPVVVEESFVQRIRGEMPKLPEQARQELVQKYGLTEYDAEVLTLERASLDYFYEVLKVSDNAKLSCNWVTSELFGLLNKHALTTETSPIKAADLGALVKLIATDVLSGKLAKMVFEEMWSNPGKTPDAIVKEKGLQQITDEKAIAAAVDKVINENPGQLAEFLSGKDRIVPFFIGKVMKETGGKANPGVVNKLVNEALNKKKV